MPRSLRDRLRSVDPVISTPTVEAVDLLCGWARENISGPAIVPPHQITTQATWQIEVRVIDLLIGAWQALRHDLQLSAAEALRWLSLYVAPGDYPTTADVHWLVREDSTGAMLSWRPVGLLGPLAYAAGLTVEEAGRRKDADALTEAELLTLTGLRGWKFPPSYLVSGGED